MANNYNIQTGRLLDHDGKTFDITVILNFPTKAEYEAATCIDNMPSVNLIDFYFGDTNDGDTEHYVNQFVEKQNKFRKLAEKLLQQIAANPDDNELREQYDFVKSLIVNLH